MIRRHRNLLVATLLLAVALAWTCSSGMDLNWDLLNYHFYGAHALLGGRLEQDYFAASYQGYFNPLAFVPFYLAVQAGIPSLLIAFALTAVHLLNVLLGWQLTREMLNESQRGSPWLPWLGAALLFAAPLFLTVMGNSFADALTSVPVLHALLILARRQPKRDWRLEAAVAGLLLGIAGGLKLTNAFLAVCACATAFVMSRAAMRSRIQQQILLGVGGLAGFALAHGYWSYELYRHFGNPVFPLFNNVFASPDFPAAAYVDRRYVSGLSLWELAITPVRLLQAASWVYSENPAPDLRPLALFGAGAVAAGLYLRRRRKGIGSETPHGLRWLSTYFLLAYLVWIAVSGNGRYGLPLLLLAGPLLAAWLAWSFRETTALVAGGAILIAQFAMQVHTGSPRWAPLRWQTPWVDVEMPAALRASPHLMLATTNQSYAAMVPWLHPDSAYVALTGLHVQPSGDAMTDKLRRQLARNPADMRALFVAKADAQNRLDRRAGTYSYRATLLLPYGLVLSGKDCEIISFRGRAAGGFLRPWKAPALDERADAVSLVACELARADPEAVASIRWILAEAGRVFDRIEDACGDQLDPPRTQVAYYYDKPYRNYFNTNRQLIYELKTGMVYLSQLGIEERIALGAASSWLRETAPPCPKFPPAHATDLIP